MADILFGNNNGKIVRKLARRHVQADKKSNWLLVLTIALSVGMILSVILSSVGIEQAFKNAEKNKAQVTVIGVTDEQLKNIREQTDVLWVGEMSLLGFFYQDDITITPVYADEDYLEKQAELEYEGDVPQNRNEVMLPENYLALFDEQYHIGDQIELDVTGTGNKEWYSICGIIKDGKESSKNCKIYLSKALARELLNDQFQITAYTRLETDLVQTNMLEDFAESTLEAAGIVPEQIFYTEYSSIMTGVIKPELPLPISFLAVIVAVLAGVVIYGIFYTMITKSVQMLGQLRTIGMTKRQVKKMSRKESRQFAYKGIPLGLLLGVVVGYAVSPKGFVLKTTILWMVIVAIISFFIIAAATTKPVRIAMYTSPLEGLRYTVYTGKKKVSHKLYRHLSLGNLARINIGRNKIKSVFTVCMLGISLMILVTTATVANSIDARKSAEFRYFPFGEIQLEIQEIARSTFDEQNEENRSTRLQLEDNPLEAPELLESLEAIDGVENIVPSSCIRLGVTFPDDMGSITTIINNVPTIDREQFGKLQELLSDSNVDYDSITDQNAILVDKDVANVGDILTVEGRAEDGTTFSKDMTVIGTYDRAVLMEEMPLCPGSPRFMITYDTGRNLTGVTNQTGILTISVKEGTYEEVAAAVQSIADASDQIDIYTIEQNIRNIEYNYNQTIKTFYFISAIMFVFGCVSLVNTLIVDYQNRKREFGLFRAIGATQPQLRKMLRMESGFYLAVSVIAAIIGGVIASIVIGFRIDKTAHCFEFEYPLSVIAVIILGTALIQVIASLYSSKIIKDTEITESIKI